MGGSHSRSKLSGHTDEVTFVDFSADGNWLVSSSRDKTLRIWDTVKKSSCATLQGHTDEVESCVFLSEGRVVASGSLDKTIRLWDVGNRSSLTTLHGHTGCVTQLAVVPDASQIASGSDDNTVKSWDPRTLSLLATYTGHGSPLLSVAYSQTCLLASASTNGAVRVWDARARSLVAKNNDHQAAVFDAQFSPDSTLLCTVSSDSSARIWDFRKGASTVLSGHSDKVRSCRFTANGKLLVTVSDDHTARVWDVAQHTCVATLVGHNAQLITCDLPSNSTLLATGSRDSTLRIWDISSEKLLQTFENHHDRINVVRFSPNGQFVATASRDKTVHVFDVTNLARACKVAAPLQLTPGPAKPDQAHPAVQKPKPKPATPAVGPAEADSTAQHPAYDTEPNSRDPSAPASHLDLPAPPQRSITPTPKPQPVIMVNDTALPLIAPNEIQMGKKLGQGGFGTVYRGTWKGLPVAVKVVQMSSASKAARTAVLREMQMVMAVRHRRVVQGYGVCVLPVEIWMVSELMTGGNVEDVLYAPKSGVPLSFVQRMSICTEVCEALLALHSATPPIVHRDLKPANVLLTDTLEAKLCDFGLARTIEHSVLATANPAGAGTSAYMAPEQLDDDPRYPVSEKSDIYACGVTLLEILTSVRPWDGKTTQQIITAILIKRKRPHVPPTMPRTVQQVLTKCFERDPHNRPDANMLLMVFQTTLKQLMAKTSG
eukprot:TRINITY_DN9420_c0_g1_i1.p1 TRINITY_DN9420_c0_g1~~TRINITY_DN9420_c0_g1_i1.p1  ORF type:complete len:727 (+),score=109.31 TRINITY_DN9420_c0_g1_i1:40-2181(+)